MVQAVDLVDSQACFSRSGRQSGVQSGLCFDGRAVELTT